MTPFFTRCYHLLDQYAATNSRWTNRQLLAKIERALAGKWDRQLEKYLDLEEADIDLDKVQDSLVAKANNLSSLPDPVPTSAFGVRDHPAPASSRQGHDDSSRRDNRSTEDCRNYARGH